MRTTKTAPGRARHCAATPNRSAWRGCRAQPDLILFHPDFNRRLRSYTGSADPALPLEEQQALAGFKVSPLPPVGSFTPPW